MAVAEFLTHFRPAALFLRAWDASDGPPTPADLAAARKSAPLWLTPDAVKDFDAADFSWLPPARRDALAAHVEQFRAAAAQVPPDAVPTDDQILTAREHFRAAYRAVGPGVFSELDQKVFRVIDEVLAEAWVPDFVVRYDCEVANDSTGDPAVWLWVIVTDESSGSDRLFQSIEPIRDAVMRALAARGIDRWVYPSVRTVTDQRELLADLVE